MGNVTSLYTKVKNTSGATRVFGFLGPRGARLEANEEMSIPGNIISTLGAGWSRRKFTAFQDSLDYNLLDIVYTPAVFLYDSGTGGTKVLALLNSSLGTADPSWTSWSSSSVSESSEVVIYENYEL